MSLSIVLLVLAGFGLGGTNLIQAQEASEHPRTVGRLNTIIENAEQGKLSFNGESWQNDARQRTQHFRNHRTTNCHGKESPRRSRTIFTASSR